MQRSCVYRRRLRFYFRRCRPLHARLQTHATVAVSPYRSRTAASRALVSVSNTDACWHTHLLVICSSASHALYRCRTWLRLQLHIRRRPVRMRRSLTDIRSDEGQAGATRDD